MEYVWLVTETDGDDQDKDQNNGLFVARSKLDDGTYIDQFDGCEEPYLRSRHTLTKVSRIITAYLNDEKEVVRGDDDTGYSLTHRDAAYHAVLSLPNAHNRANWSQEDMLDI
eukprot:gnl/Dysnectes_brevis/7629_a12973_187.p1 GENE.gnl/Dysnectes_brevis/7629_a12973_187~~gnl/Dysnectes_brevis/7629_a12973_187.p1  ORF type:complete len:112 (-),score=13.60 gnl/Dysnectes_brevis/7629_a12973_187:73-408(-)